MLVIMDLDGTILNSENTHYHSFLKSFKRNGVKLSNEQKNGIKSRFGMSAIEIIREVSPDISEKKVKDVARGVKEISVSEEFYRVRFINGSKKFLLNNFKKHDLAIATNSSKEFTMKALISLKILKCFRFIATANDVKNPKPDPEMISLILKSLNYKKSDCVFIGDSIFDYYSSKAAGIRFIAVLSKSDYKKELKILAESYNDLSKVKI